LGVERHLLRLTWGMKGQFTKLGKGAARGPLPLGPDQLPFRPASTWPRLNIQVGLSNSGLRSQDRTQGIQPGPGRVSEAEGLASSPRSGPLSLSAQVERLPF
jgi:hypothetical protein